MQITQIKDLVFVHFHPFRQVSYRQDVGRSNMIPIQ